MAPVELSTNPDAVLACQRVALVALVETADDDHRVLGDTEQLGLIADARTGWGDIQLASRYSQLLGENRTFHGLPAFDQRHPLLDQVALKSLILDAGRVEDGRCQRPSSGWRKDLPDRS